LTFKKDYKGIVVAVVGPPHSGKSVFLAELYRQLLQRRPSGFVFLQRAAPDGEGMWSNESDPKIVAEIRRKGAFSREFMVFTLQSIENLAKVFPLVLLDLGGKRSAENAEILARSTHVIIVSSKEEEIQPWIDFAAAEGCEVLAVFTSRLGEGQSWIDFSTTPLRGEMVNLDRDGPKDPYSMAISKFADWLIQFVDKKIKSP
jgi:CRISPR-associated protein Csx3